MNNRKVNNSCMRLQRWSEVLHHLAGFENLLKPESFHTPEEVAALRRLRALLFECQSLAKAQTKNNTERLRRLMKL
ncbi:MAG: hypothetical protein II832_11070 [Synergistaceae bacterium]|nr:hypothetical protein [Synergistaceae bacterium]